MRDVKIKNPEFLKLLDNISGLVDQVFDDKEFLDREHKLSFDHRNPEQRRMVVACAQATGRCGQGAVKFRHQGNATDGRLWDRSPLQDFPAAADRGVPRDSQHDPFRTGRGRSV